MNAGAKPGMFPDWYAAGLLLLAAMIADALCVGIVYGLWLLCK